MSTSSIKTQMLEIFMSFYRGMNQQIWLFKLIIKNLEYGKIQSGPAGIFNYDTEQNTPKKIPIFISLHQITPGSNIPLPQYRQTK